MRSIGLLRCNAVLFVTKFIKYLLIKYNKRETLSFTEVVRLVLFNNWNTIIYYASYDEYHRLYMCVYAVLNIRESSLIIIITTIGGRPTKCELVTRSRCISRQSHNSTVRGGQNYRVCFHKILKTLYRLTLSHSTCVLDAINNSYKIHTYI